MWSQKLIIICLIIDGAIKAKLERRRENRIMNIRKEKSWHNNFSRINTNGKETKTDGRKLKSSGDNIEIWEDLVNIKDLVKALVICMITTFGGYFLGPDDSYKPLLFGLAGAITGFLISSILIEPKRIFRKENQE